MTGPTYLYMQKTGIDGSYPVLPEAFYALYQAAGWTLDPDQIQDVAPVRNIDIVGALSDGQTPVWDAASQHFKPGTPGSGTSGLPSQTGNSGKVLGTDGTAASWVVPSGGGSSPLTDVAASVSANGALVVGKHNPVNASGGTRAMTLADAGSAGLLVSLEKTDSSVNTVTVTGTLRGVANATITLPWQYEALLLMSKADGSWWPVAGHKTKAALDATYAPVAGTGRHPLTGRFHADGQAGATVAARIQNAVLACEAAGGGIVQLPATGTIGDTETVTILGAASDGWSVGKIEINGAGLGSTLTKTGGQAMFAVGPANTTAGTTNVGNNINLILRNFELAGPGKATSGAIGVDKRTTGGSILWDNVYIHGFDIGVRYHDVTLVSGYQLQVRECNIGMALGFASDAHKYIGCRFDWNGIGVHIGYTDSARSQTARTNQWHASSLDGVMCSFNQIGILVEGNDSYSLSIRDSYLEQFTDVAIRIGDAGLASGVPGHVLVDNCYINGNTGSNVATYWSTTSGKRANSIEVNLAYSVTIRGTGFFGNTDAPINIRSTSAGVRVEPGRFHQGSGESGDVRLPDGTYAWVQVTGGQTVPFIYNKQAQAPVGYTANLPTASAKWLGAKLRLYSTNVEYRCESDGSGGYAWYAMPSNKTLTTLAGTTPSPSTVKGLGPGQLFIVSGATSGNSLGVWANTWDFHTGASDSIGANVLDIPDDWLTYDVYVVWSQKATATPSGTATFQFSRAIVGAGDSFNTALSFSTPVADTVPGQYVAVLTKIGTGITHSAGKAQFVKVSRQSSDATFASDIMVVGLRLVKAS